MLNVLLLLHVPYLSTLDDTAALHLSLSIAIPVACSYRIPVHFLILSYQLVLRRPLPLVPSMYPSNNVLYTLFSCSKCPKYLSFLALNMLTNVRFSSILWGTSSFVIFYVCDNFSIFLYDHISNASRRFLIIMIIIETIFIQGNLFSKKNLLLSTKDL